MRFRFVLYVAVTVLLLMAAALAVNPSFRYLGNEAYNGLDIWEYQTVAVNFSEHNRFPVMGFLGDEAGYDLRDLKATSSQEYMKCRFRDQGPVTYVGKPPLYSLLLGLTYKLFAPRILYAYYFNLACFACMLSLMLYLGHTLAGKWGFVIALAAIVLYMAFGAHKFSDVLPAYLFTAITMGIVSVTVSLLKKPGAGRYALLGALFAAAMLTKGNVVFIVVFALAGLTFFNRKRKGNLRGLGLAVLSFALLLLPWVILANQIRVNRAEEWRKWKERVIAGESRCEVDFSRRNEWSKKETRIVESGYHHKLISHLYTRMVAADVFIVISNQVTPDELLSVHNEYAVDGDFHPEWRYLTDGVYHNQYLDHPNYLQKMACFYADRPRLIYEIALAKLFRAGSQTNAFFHVAAFLFGMIVLYRRIRGPGIRKGFALLSVAVCLGTYFVHPQVYMLYSLLFFVAGLLFYARADKRGMPFIFPVCILNSYLILFIFYGEARFINVIEPLTAFLCVYWSYLFLAEFVKGPPVEETDFSSAGIS